MELIPLTGLMYQVIVDRLIKKTGEDDGKEQRNLASKSSTVQKSTTTLQDMLGTLV